MWRVPSFVGATLILYLPSFGDQLGVPIPGEIAFAVVVAFAFAVAFAGGGAGAGAGAGLVNFCENRYGRHPMFRVSYSVFLLGALSLALGLSPQQSNSTGSQSYAALSFGLLPLVNGLADFASIGSTRLFLRRSLDSHRWAFGQTLWDLVIGLGIFLLLGTSVIAFIGYVRFSDGGTLLNLEELFDGLKTAPSDYAWFLIMLMTTLLPTLAHSALGLFALVFSYPKGLRRAIAARIHNGRQSDIDGLFGTLGLSALIAGSIWLTYLIGWLLVSYLHLTEGMIHFFEWIAKAIGAM